MLQNVEIHCYELQSYKTRRKIIYKVELYVFGAIKQALGNKLKNITLNFDSGIVTRAQQGASGSKLIFFYRVKFTKYG